MNPSLFRSPMTAALLCAALGTALPASAQMYKWVDERGVVSYSNTPPPSVSRSKVAEVAERITVYSPDAEVNRAMTEEARRDSKAERLGRQLEAERAAHRATAAAAAREAAAAGAAPSQAQITAAYERCLADRRVDCESIRTGVPSSEVTYGYTGYYGPDFVVGGRRHRQPPPFAVLNTPDNRVGINNAPPVGVSKNTPFADDRQPNTPLRGRAPITR